MQQNGLKVKVERMMRRNPEIRGAEIGRKLGISRQLAHYYLMLVRCGGRRGGGRVRLTSRAAR